MTLVDNEKFYSSIINLVVGDKKQAAIVKDLQMHPARNAIVHLDMQRVVETEKIRIHIPIHFKGEAASPGVKSQGGVVSHRIADVEVSCLPKDLPEFIELDLSQMEMNESKHLSDLPLPEGVTISGHREEQCRGRFDSSAPCGRAGTDRRSRCRDACGRAAAAPAEGAPLLARSPATRRRAAPAADAKAPLRLPRRRKAARSNGSGVRAGALARILSTDIGNGDIPHLVVTIE